jgi:hypothetical protein
VNSSARPSERIQALRTDAEISDPFGSPIFKAFSRVHGSELHHLFLRLSLGHGTNDTADSHGRLSIDCAVTNRDGAGRVGDGWPRRVAGGVAGRALAMWPERVPWAGGADRLQRTGRTPLMMRACGTPYASRAQPDQISQDRLRFRQNASNIPTHETAPFSLNGRYLRRICNRDCRRRVLETPMENKVVPVSFGCDLLAPWLWRIQWP